MGKKVLKVASFVLCVVILGLVFTPVASSSEGTCCPQEQSICVTPTENIMNYYWKGVGPCD